MFRSLYMRLLVVFIAVLIVAMGFLSIVLYQQIRLDKTDARLNELMIQAKDLAYLAGQRVGRAVETDRYLVWKYQEIMGEYDAYVVILDRQGKLLSIGDDTMEYSFDFPLEDTLHILSSVLSGYEFKGQTPLEGGSIMYSVGVPYFEDGNLFGAVIIHASEQNIEASYKSIVKESVRAMVIAFAIGSVLILIMSQYISRPLRAMAQAADRYARGDFSKTVPVKSKDEVGRLAEALNKMAADLDRLEQTRREFVANVSHELRSPLTSMQGFIQGILDGTVPEEEQAHYLGIALDETRRLNKLITALLELTQMDNGQQVLHQQKFDIDEMIARILLRQEGRITEKGMEVQVDFQEEPCYVLADPDRIEQVLVNLVDNAVKYGKIGGEIRLKTAREGTKVTIAVGNESDAIAPEDLPHIFDRFYRVNKAHTSGEGTGLGLAIAKSIVEQHGQEIHATSSQLTGTEFVFTLEGA